VEKIRLESRVQFVNLSFEGAAEASAYAPAKDSQGLCMAGDDLLRLESGSPPSLS
jgi:hypothetical protein